MEALTAEDLEEVLRERYDVTLQSITFGDLLLFAKFLPDGEFLLSLSIAELMAHAKQNSKMDDEDDNEEEVNTKENEKDDENENGDEEHDDYSSIKGRIDSDELLSDPLAEVFGDEEHGMREYIDLTVACQNDDEQDIRLPSVRVRISSLSNFLSDSDSDDRSDRNGMKSSKSHRRRKRKSTKSLIDQIVDFAQNIFRELPFRFGNS